MTVLQIPQPSSGFEAAEVPVLALSDICKAFPSIAHVWLFAVLRCLKFSSEIVNVILHLYANCAAGHSCGIGIGGLLFYVFAGVRAGCPLSANFFCSGSTLSFFLLTICLMGLRSQELAFVRTM